LRGVQLAAGIGLAIVLALAWYGRSPRWLLRLPRVLRRPAALMVRMGTGRRLLAPILLAAANWVTQWVCYDLVLRAAGIHLPPVASFSALLAVNIGGLGRLTPGNLGVTQAAIVAALLPFGVDVQRSLAAALALQAIQLVPVLALAAAAVGFGGLRGLVRDRASSVLSTGVTLGNSA